MVVFNVFSTPPEDLSRLPIHLSVYKVSLIELFFDIFNRGMPLSDMSPTSSSESLFDHCSFYPLTLINLHTDICLLFERWSPFYITVYVFINIVELFKMVDLIDKILGDAQVTHIKVIDVSNFHFDLKFGRVFLKVCCLL